jgi:dTMP kinase
VIIGIEGLSCTGKTTLAAAISARLGRTTVVPCYHHTAPDPSALPGPYLRPGPRERQEDEQLDALAVYLNIEVLRRRRTRAATEPGRHVVLDRTVDTLLAHVRGVGDMNGLDVNTPARALVAEQLGRDDAVLPDLTLLLRAGHEVLAARARTRVAMPSLYYDPVFADGFHAHFRDPLTPMCVPIDAAAPADQVAGQALAALEPFLCGVR